MPFVNIAVRRLSKPQNLDTNNNVHYNGGMRKIFQQKPKSRIQIGCPFEEAIKKYLLPATNADNLSKDWTETDWTRWSLAAQIAKRNNGKIPKDCLDLLPEFIPDLDL